MSDDTVIPDSAISSGRRAFTRWWATIAFIALVLANAYTLSVLANQNNQIETLVRENTAFVERTIETECEIRKEARETVRQIFFGILAEFDPSETITGILNFIETDYPEITCPAVILEE